ncbi:hypothetical protein AAG570_012089 [Ranatra chinensis]|uniref:DUF4485 domain-containing protein n=1 Tax=Ranatra chinensis TaxID=642074 RepID=A0ABD0YHS6_9HEMI
MEEEREEDVQEMDELARQVDDEEFNLYFGIAKHYVLRIMRKVPESSKACSWLLKIKSCPDRKLRMDYLKVFLFAIYLQKLVGPFSQAPPDGDLEKFPEGVDVTNVFLLIVARRIISGLAGVDCYASVVISKDIFTVNELRTSGDRPQ